MNHHSLKNNFLILIFVFFSFQMGNSQNKFSNEELIGKGNPELFGEGKLRKEAYTSFEKMKVAAAKDGFKIKIVSGYRNFERQKGIFERKFTRFTKQGMTGMEAIRKIIEYSTIPGTSRHHWGTDIDIIDDNATYSGDVLVPEKFHGDGPFCKFREWLEKHANSFGFYIVYTPESNRKGFKYEPWHYSYAPISKPMLKVYQKIDLIKVLHQEELKGASYFTDAFIKQYYQENILDINPELK
ncbi:M15 family metallopeptidase [Ascidiimonas sp. W6]|uniref:M15 family metallopeptidase n=1 Tax=Ascidiimonas meishanensis TaxID=3128903 RepID=UPI0030EE2ED0